MNFSRISKLHRKILITDLDNTKYLLDPKIKIRNGFNKYISEIKLEYLGSEISLKGILKIAIARMVEDFYKDFNNALSSLIFQYYVELPDNIEARLPIQVSSIHSHEVWVSRNASISGVLPSYLSRVFEYDYMRRKKTPRILVWSTSKSFKVDLGKFPDNFGLQTRVINKVKSIKFGSYYSQELENAEIYHGTCLVVNGEYVPLSSKISEFNAAWPDESPTSFDGNFYLLKSNKTKYIEKANFTGHSNSWFHFIIEYLPCLIKIPLLNRTEPLIIPKGCPKQIKEIIGKIGFTNILEMNAFESIKIGKLTICLDYKNSTISDFKNSEIKLLREKINSLFNGNEKKSVEIFEKIYLKRNANLFRDVGNRKKIEEILSANDFKVIDPMDLTLTEQFNLINNAKIVVAESGAAITSLIFSKNKIMLVELRTNRKTDLNFWKEFAIELGHSYIAIDSNPIYGRYLNNFSIKSIRRDILSLI
jgi:hypothetical protein